MSNRMVGSGGVLVLGFTEVDPKFRTDRVRI